MAESLRITDYNNLSKILVKHQDRNEARSDLRPVYALDTETDDNDKCFEGFGVIRRESSITEVGGGTVSFSTDTLEAELIDDTGLFELNLLRLQRTET